MSTFLPEPEALILVAVLPEPRDLKIAKTLGWYRMRANKAPKVISVDYVAFYQTAKFGELRWQVQYFAEVRGHELVTRKELMRQAPDHPRANDRYFKLQLGNMYQLELPIVATNWRRLTFLYTTGLQFNAASTLTDLVVRGQERELLWTALKERQATFTPEVFSDAPQVDIDLSLILALQSLGKLDDFDFGSIS